MLEQLYQQMVRIRVIEESIASHYPEQEMRCPVHLSIGQEAVAVGVCSHLKKEDWVFSTHRSHAHYLAKGGNLGAMLAELHGKETGCCQGRGGSMHLVDKDVNFYAIPIVASAIPIAIGVAKAIKQRDAASQKCWCRKPDVYLGRESVTNWKPITTVEISPGVWKCPSCGCQNIEPTKSSKVVVCFLGDAAAESGQFWESINLAQLWRLPILFVLEDNGLSVSTPQEERQPFHGRWNFAGLNHVECYLDGMDVKDVSQSTEMALENIRTNSVPAALSFCVERYSEHCGPNLSPDPCDKSRDWEPKMVGDAFYDQAKRIFELEFRRALSYAKSSSFPNPNTIMEGVYA